MRDARFVVPILALAACGGSEITLEPPDPFEPPNPAAAPEDFGSWLSMDVAPDGTRLVMSYYDREEEALGFAVGTPDAAGAITWLHERVDGYQDGERGQYSSMRVGPDGTVWIAYHDVDDGLRFAHRQAGGPATQSTYSWTTGTIDEGELLGTWASLDLQPDGTPVVAYHDEANGTLKVARLAGIDGDTYNWDVSVAVEGQPFNGEDAEGQPVVRPADVGEYARLWVEQGQQIIAYYDRGQRALGIAISSDGGGSWSAENISQPGVDAGQWPSILVDAGVIHVAYHDVQNQNLLVQQRVQNAWQPPELVDNAPFVGADTEIVKRGGNLTIVYFDGQNNDMKIATKAGAGWSSQRFGPEGHPVGFHNEIVRAGDRWYAVSYDFTDRSIFQVALDPGVQQN